MIFVQMFRDGGAIMIVIGVCSLIAAYIFLAKWFQFHRASINTGELVAGLVNVLRRDGMIEAITLCDHTPGPVARLLNSAIYAYRNDDDIRQALEDQSLVEVPRLEAYLNVLATIAYVTPLLGLLGTVVGMFEAFRAMENGMSMTLPDLSKGVYMALTCTAAGLCVSIPCHVAYNYLLSRVQHFCVEMEKASSEILYFFSHHKKQVNPESAPDQTEENPRPDLPEIREGHHANN